MSFLVTILSFIWLIRTIKLILFWLYLWQLKEYHIPRFIDHFRTQKGKQVLFSPINATKVILLITLVLAYYIYYPIIVIVFFIYLAEVAVFVYSALKDRVKSPVLTPKTVLLMSVSAVVVLGYVLFLQYAVTTDFWVVTLLLVFDVLLPGIASAIVLAVQPLFVVMRNNILQQARAKRESLPKLKVIGITGSYGKTSTKEFLTAILSKKFKVLETPDHKNSEMGIAQTILSDLKPSHEIFIAEMGSYAKGGIKLLCDMTHPSIGIVTGVNEQHLALFGSMENLLSAEGGKELLENLPPDGLMVFNGENKHCVELYKEATINKKLYTVENKVVQGDIWTESVTVERNTISFIVRSQDKDMAHIQVSVLGKHHVQNLLGAILVAKQLGMTLPEIASACREITQKQAGMTLSTGPHNIEIVDSSYSANPDGVAADLDYLSIFPKKKVIVMPSLIELGEASKRIHQEVGRNIAKVCKLAIITTADGFEDIRKGATEQLMPYENVVLLENGRDIFTLITTSCGAGDVVLLEGRVPKELIELLSQ